MARKTTVAGFKVRRGKNIVKTAKGWRLVTPGERFIKAALIKMFWHRNERFAIFRVL